MLNVYKVKLLLAAVISLSVTNILAAPPIKWVEGQIIVKPRAGLSDAQLEKILNKAKGRSVSKLQQIGAHIVKVAPQAEDAVIRALSNNPRVDYAEKDMLVELSAFTPDDPKYTSQWHLPKIQAPAAWDYSIGQGVTIAILDTGVEGGHPDLVNNLVPGRNVASNNNDTSPVMWHGTSVAGVAAATGNNATGVSSVAWGANIMPVRVTNRSDGVAQWSDLASGILWAADHGADVVNMSYDVAIGAYLLNDAAQYLRSKGGVVVHAAGNANTDGGYSDNPYMITVSATTSSDTKASFSNYGNQIDVAAPGKDIYTTYQNGSYANTWGTSFASPATAGVVALIMAANSNLSPDEVEAVLKDSADDLGSNGWDSVFGYGRVNADAAVQMVMQTSGSDTQAPTVSISSPSDSEIVSGTVLVDVDAQDNTGVSEVALYANGQSVGTDLTAPFQFSWDSSQVADGNATFTAYAYDAANNTGISQGVTVTVDNQPDNVDNTPPSVSITTPAAGSSIVSGTVQVSVNAWDDTGVTEVEIYENGQLAGIDGIAPYEFSWDSTQVADGNVTLTARAYDLANNTGVSSGVTVSVDNQPDVVDNAPPTVSIMNPVDGSTVSGTASLSASANDDVGVTLLSIYVDNNLICSSADTTNINCRWNTRKASSGSHTIKAVAKDAAGKSAETVITVSTGSSGNGKGKNR